MFGKSEDPCVLHVGNMVKFRHVKNEGVKIKFYDEQNKLNTVDGDEFKDTIFVIRDIIVKPIEIVGGGDFPDALLIELEITHTGSYYPAGTIIWVPKLYTSSIFQYPLERDVLNLADELIGILEWSSNITGVPVCPICKRRKVDEHDSTCKIKKYKEMRAILGG